MSNSKRIAKNTVFLYMRSFVVLLISLYTSRVILDVLGVEDYGIYSVVGGVIGMLGFLGNTMQSTYQRFFNIEMGHGNSSGITKIFQLAITTQIILAIIILFLAETIGLWFVTHKLVIPQDRLVAASRVYQATIISFIITIFTSPYGALITAYEKMGVFAVISVIDAVLKLVIVLLLRLLPGDDLISYSYLLLLISAINIVSYIVYCRVKIPCTKFKCLFERDGLVSLVSFSGWSLLGIMAQTLKTQGVDILLNMFFGPIVNAARGIANQIQNAVSQFVTSFQTSFRPQLTQSYGSGDYQGMSRLFFSASKISYILIYAISLPILFETNTILDLWLGSNVPKYTVPFVRIILLTSLCGAFSNPTTCIVYATGNIKKYSLFFCILNTLIIPLSYVALKLGCSPVAVLYIGLIMTIIVLTASLVILGQITEINLQLYISKVIIPCVIFSGTCLVVPYIIILCFNDGVIRLIFNAVCSIIWAALLAYYICFNLEEKQMVKSVFYRFRNKHDCI